MKESDVQRSLFWKFNSASQMMIPNYTPLGWWECDLLRAMKSGYIFEYEIKLSVADFKKDAQKRSKDNYCRTERRWKAGDHNKHELLEEGRAQSDKGFLPNRFYFVLDRDIVDKVELPAWAGAFSVFNGNAPGAKPWCVLKEIKKAPLIHKEKSDVDWMAHLASTFYWRYWNIKAK